MTRSFLLNRTARQFTQTFALGLVLAGVAMAQSDPERYNTPTGPIYTPQPAYPVEMGFSQDHSSTAYEGGRRGDAALLQARGNFLLNRSQADVLSQQAWAMEMDNGRQFVAYAVWNKKRQEEDREERVSAKRKENDAVRPEKMAAAYRLSSRQFNPQTGAIAWPTILADTQYAAMRDRIECGFRYSTAGTISAAEKADILRATQDMVRVLRGNVAQMPTDQYMAAQTFLRGLTLEAQSRTVIN